MLKKQNQYSEVCKECSLTWLQQKTKGYEREVIRIKITIIRYTLVWNYQTLNN